MSIAEAIVILRAGGHAVQKTWIRTVIVDGTEISFAEAIAQAIEIEDQ